MSKYISEDKAKETINILLDKIQTAAAGISNISKVDSDEHAANAVKALADAVKSLADAIDETQAEEV